MIKKNITRFLCSSFVSLLLSTPALASGFSGMGVKGGLNISNLYSNQPDSLFNTGKISKNGLICGAFVTFTVLDMLDLQLEILYSEKGAVWKYTNYTETWDLAYVEIPLLAVLNITPHAKLEPILFLGPTLGFTQTAQKTIVVQGVSTTGNLREVKRNVDIGITFGGGLIYPVGPGSFLLDARYNLGISNIDNSGETFDYYGTHRVEVWNGAVALMLGYSLNL